YAAGCARESMDSRIKFHRSAALRPAHIAVREFRSSDANNFLILQNEIRERQGVACAGQHEHELRASATICVTLDDRSVAAFRPGDCMRQYRASVAAEREGLIALDLCVGVEGRDVNQVAGRKIRD